MGKKLSKRQRAKLIEEIMDEIRVNLHCYKDFVLDCVEDALKGWSDEDLSRFVYAD